jgi:signal recognition particle receptor subunit beta
MNTHKTTPLEKNVDNKFIEQYSQAFPVTILMSILVTFSTIIILWWTKRRRQRLTRHGECLFLCGIANSGKTLLFHRLTSDVEQQTSTSMETNHGTMTLDYLSTDRPIKKVHVMDIPGNSRIRHRDFNAYKTSAKAIIFVIDSTTIYKKYKDVSDYLYEILCEKCFRDQRLPLLIFCNKHDVNKKDHNIQSIRYLLEHELTMKRKLHASSVNLLQEKNDINNDDVDIGRLGKENFGFNDVKDIRIEFVEGSALNVRKKSSDTQYDDAEDSDSGPHLLKVHQWIARIWFK